MQNAQVDCADWGTLAFFKAAEISDVTRCLQAGANSNVLPLAALVGAAGAVRVLLGAGANLEARTGGLTPLHLAASSGGTEAVTALLEAGANLEARRTGNRPDPAAFSGVRWGCRSRDGAAGSGRKTWRREMKVARPRCIRRR